jgi:nitronate monooxygenase
LTKGPGQAWCIWGAGQGVGNIDEVLPARELVTRLQREYAAARAALMAKAAASRDEDLA